MEADPSFIPWSVYLKLLLAAGAPFMAFGSLDNATLVLAGDAVDRYLGGAWGLSDMASAAVGGVVSGVAGIQVHGLAGRWVRAAPPALTAAQQRSKSFLKSERIGNAAGMVLGLIIGMTPLFFVGDNEIEEEVKEDNVRLQTEADRTRRVRQVRRELTAGEQRERQRIESEERLGRAAVVTEAEAEG